MQSVLTPGYIANFIINLFIFILLISVYTYIEKLEKVGNCECAYQYPHLAFIKSFSIFALIFILFVMFVPPGTLLASIFGKEITGIYLFVIFVFYIVFAVYLYMTMSYTRMLITKKCECSEDIRRELIFAGSTIEMIIIVLMILTLFIFPFILSGLTIFFKNIKSASTTIESNLKDPVKGIVNIPSQISKMTGQVKSIVKKTSSGVKSLAKKN
tara:strand:+ start:7900 stop:8538 length:639 start_codon:yes stop_codon:yes gene_type:complete